MSKTNEAEVVARPQYPPRRGARSTCRRAERAENSTVWDGKAAVHRFCRYRCAEHRPIASEGDTKLSHTCFQVLAYEPCYIELAEESPSACRATSPEEDPVGHLPEAVENRQDRPRRHRPRWRDRSPARTTVAP